jgi:flagellin
MTRINTNVSSLVAQKSLAKSNDELQTALNRLSTGLRINSGKDDPAGLIASEVLRSDIVSVQRAVTNSERANQLIATADSALGQVSSLLNDIRGLVSEAANTGALSDDQIAANQLQIDSSLEAIDRISQTTSFQGRRLLDGSLGFVSTDAGNFSTNATGTIGGTVGAAASGSFAGLVTLSATATGSTGNADVVIVSANAATSASYTNGTLTVTRSATATATDIATAITAEGTFSATASSAGTVAAATYTGATTGGTDNNQIVLSATSGGSAFNGANVVFSIVSNAAADATFSAGTLTISVSAAATTSDVIGAINAQGSFSASTAGAGLGVYSATDNASAATSGGGTSGNIRDLQIDQANFGTASSIGVQVDVDTQATQGTLTYSGGAVASDLVLQIGGGSGFQVFNFGTGTSVSQIATAINQVSDATGVSATVKGTGLELKSTEYGSDAFVSAKAITGSFDTKNSAAVVSGRESGTDVVARINGVQATGRGLEASINTSTLELSFKVNSGLSDGASFNFSITSGGANFQLGPDVVSNQQARLGIQGVSSATLGGASGSLFELRSGGAKDLKTDVKGAARVVDEVITAVTGLRGRLGAFQKTTLETNINSLNDTLENLTAAQSSIRDADFAAESANLTRAQILVQAGTSVLSIANQRPQNVLALLQR